MKLRISSKLASVHSELEVSNADGEVLFSAHTDPLSSPRTTHVSDASGAEVARFTTSRSDDKDRAHHIELAGGVTMDLKRAFRVSAKTDEAIIRVQPQGWMVVTRRAWTSRFEVRTEGGRVMARAKQVPALRGDVYDIEVLDEARLPAIAVLSIITRSIIRDDSPSPV